MKELFACPIDPATVIVTTLSPVLYCTRVISKHTTTTRFNTKGKYNPL